MLLKIIFNNLTHLNIIFNKIVKPKSMPPRACDSRRPTAAAEATAPDYSDR